MDSAKIAQLEVLGAKQNGGRGVSCVRQMVQELKRGGVDAARTIYEVDGDKVRQYPELYRFLEAEMFGCRVHLTFNCQEFPCK
jgi:PDZ domain-containing secreted protein